MSALCQKQTSASFRLAVPRRALTRSGIPPLQSRPLKHISARLSSFCAARLQSVRLRASRRLQGLHQHRSWAHPICPMHECHAQQHRRHPDPLCNHFRLLSGCEMIEGITPCGDDAPVRSPRYAPTFRAPPEYPSLGGSLKAAKCCLTQSRTRPAPGLIAGHCF